MHKFIGIIWFMMMAFSVFGKESATIDSVLHQTMTFSQKYSEAIDSYDADVYLRTYSNTEKKNFLYKYLYRIPNFVLYDHKSNNAIIETMNEVHYRYPDNYAFDVHDANGTLVSSENIFMIPYNFLNINIYSKYTNDKRFFMPLRFSTKKYYRYTLVDVYKQNGTNYFKVKYMPKISSSKLLTGCFTVQGSTWLITDFYGEGKDMLLDFSIQIKMGTNSLEKILPKQFKITRTHYFLGNNITNTYRAKVDYISIKAMEKSHYKKTFNVGNTYRLHLDSMAVIRKKSFWKERDSLPMTDGEKALFLKLQETKSLEEEYEHKHHLFYNNQTARVITQSIVANTNYYYKKTEINYSGLLNPAMISYSTASGVLYKLNLGFTSNFQFDRQLHVSASASYAVKYNDLLADISMLFIYNPKHFGNLSLSCGEGNRSFSSSFIQQVQDSLTLYGLKFNDLFKNSYKDYYAGLHNNIEVINGLQLTTNVDYHIRRAFYISNPNEVMNNDSKDQLLQNMREYFIPSISITWTPAQYYRMEGYTKIYDHSFFPTFKVDYAHCFRGILGSNAEYDKIEADINQNIGLGLTKTLQYHIGGGMYLRTITDYFADFSYFSRYNFPNNWNDKMGGIFNLLPYDAYNASNYYIQAHARFETPFLLFALFPQLPFGILNERLYLSELNTAYLPSYTEIGYGVGNRFVNVGVFVSFVKTKYTNIGAKFVFLLK